MTRLLPMPDTTIHVPVLTEQAGDFSWEPHSEATSNQNSMGEILPEPPPNFLLLSVQSYRKCFNQGFLDCLVLSEEWRRKVESNSSSSCYSRLRDVSVIFFSFFSLILCLFGSSQILSKMQKMFLQWCFKKKKISLLSETAALTRVNNQISLF